MDFGYPQTTESKILQEYGFFIIPISIHFAKVYDADSSSR
jgi:hypothetical protein